MLTIADQLTEQLSYALQRKASTICSRWACNYINLSKPVPGPMRFEHHPWAKEWCDQTKNWVGKKAAQMGMTNAVLAQSLFTLDIKKNSVLYILPKRTDATDFTSTKFDPILDNSDYLDSLFSGIRNVGLKQAGSASLYIRGSRSRSALKSISVGLIVYDEYDEMHFANLQLARQRSAGYKKEDVQWIKVSTPTVPDIGISKEFTDSTQSYYVFRCPSCSQFQELIYPNCLQIDSDPKAAQLICPRCKHILPTQSPEAKMSWINESNCEWVPKIKHEISGYHINAFYSIVRPLEEIAETVIAARTDELADKELNNSILGKEHLTPGARVTVQQVESCKGTHANERPAKSSRLVTMGVDVGHKVLYVNIDEWLVPPSPGPSINVHAIPRTLAIVQVANFSQLEQLLHTYQVLHTCIDAQPEQRESVDFAQRFPGRVNLVRFVRGIKGRKIVSSDSDFINVNRTVWLDTSQGRYFRGTKGIILPANSPSIYSKHISALIKNEYRDEDSNLKSRYVSAWDDHFAFARVYSEIALPLSLSASENKDVQAFL